MKIYNFIDNDDEDVYKMTTTLTWKKLNTYNYVGEDEHKYSRYKGAVVPTTLTRIFRRCSRHDERKHHDKFIFRILKTRRQCLKRIENKRERFFKGLGVGTKNKFRHDKMVFITTFDDVSNSHVISKDIYSNAAKFKFQIIYKSKPNTASLLCPKRKILTRVKQHFDS
jgi:hypothetical protein